MKGRERMERSGESVQAKAEERMVMEETEAAKMAADAEKTEEEKIAGDAEASHGGERSRETSAAGEPPEIMRLEIEGRSCNEAFARVVVAVFTSRLDPTLEEIDDIKTAVSEAVTNAVIHGYENRGGTIYIEAALSGRELTVTVRDEGVGIEDVARAMEPMYTTDCTGERSGMGFAFMEAFMDQVEVWSEPGKGTAVTMKKRIGG